MKRTIISEVEGFTCNNHSLGWIDDQGNWNDCGGMSHGEWLIINYYNNRPPERYTIPPNWIKVSNANNIFFCGESFDDVTASQVDALIEMWSLCREYSEWIKNEPETFYVTFGTIDQHESKEKLLDMFEMTIPEFLVQYGNRKTMNNFYEMLLGETTTNRGYLMNKKYRNPFAANPEEIGQEDIPVEDAIMESTLRNYIRTLLIENNEATVKQEAKSLVNMLFSEIEKFWTANNASWYKGYKKEDYEKNFLNAVWFSLLDSLNLKGNPYPFRDPDHSSPLDGLYENNMYNEDQLKYIGKLAAAQQEVEEHQAALAKVREKGKQVAGIISSSLEEDGDLRFQFFVALHSEYEKRGMNRSGYFAMTTSSPRFKVRAYQTHIDSHSDKSKRERREEAEWESRLSTDEYLDYID